MRAFYSPDSSRISTKKEFSAPKIQTNGEINKSVTSQSNQNSQFKSYLKERNEVFLKKGSKKGKYLPNLNFQTELSAIKTEPADTKGEPTSERLSNLSTIINSKAFL